MLRWNLEQKIHRGKKRYMKESTEKAGTIIPVTCERRRGVATEEAQTH